MYSVLKCKNSGLFILHQRKLFLILKIHFKVVAFWDKAKEFEKQQHALLYHYFYDISVYKFKFHYQFVHRLRL